MANRRRMFLTRWLALPAAIMSLAAILTAATPAWGAVANGPVVLASAGDDTATPTGTASLAALKHGPRQESTPWGYRLVSLAGLAVMMVLAWVLSNNRRVIPWRVVGFGLGLQVVFALLVLKTGPGRFAFDLINAGFVKLLEFTEQGARFVFGNLVHNNVPVGTVADPASGAMAPLMQTGVYFANVGSYFAFNVLPTIIFFSSLMTVLYHLGVMQKVVKAMAWVMQRSMKVSGAESLSTSANIFVGQTEAPLIIRPYVAGMTNSELMAVMTGGFATVAGGVMAAYIGMLKGYIPDIGGHLLSASVMSAPAALLVAKLMFPETGAPATMGTVPDDGGEKPHVNVIDAAAGGAADGLKLALNVAAMLMAFISLIALLNALVGAAGGLFGLGDLSLEKLLGYIFWPFALVMGIPVHECMQAGQLLGEKTVINEFVAYLHLAQGMGQGSGLSTRSVIILSYALCGFANFGSIAIQLGGIGGIAPSRRGDLARLGLRAMVGGTLAAFMTACIAGVML